PLLCLPAGTHGWTACPHPSRSSSPPAKEKSPQQAQPATGFILFRSIYPAINPAARSSLERGTRSADRRRRLLPSAFDRFWSLYRNRVCFVRYLRMRFARLPPMRLVELFRASPGNRQGIPLLPGVDSGNLNDLADVIAGVAQGAFQG